MGAEITSSSVVRHFISAVKFAAAQAYPYKHIYTQNVFPWDYYELLRYSLPGDEEYTDKRFEDRAICDVSQLKTQFWKDLNKWMLGNEVFEAVQAKFVRVLKERFPGKREAKVDLRLVRDTSSYKINPHTDLKEKAVSLLIYLPFDNSLARYGTSIYASKKDQVCLTGKARYEFEDFNKVATMPFLPNSMLGFARTDRSFHGVEPIGAVTRDVLLYNVYMQ